LAEHIVPRSTHPERHSVSRIGWLRAAVLGANDGIVSTGSLIVGVAAANASRPDVIIAGLASLVAGAMSMAAGEFVSVSSQSDTERADIARECEELRTQPEFERLELVRIYEGRGLDPKLAREVASQLMSKDQLAAHARDELGITEFATARPLQAAIASAATFSAGAAAPLVVVLAAPQAWMVPAVAIVSVLCLALLGALGARAGGAPVGRSIVRVGFWGMLALALTAGIGRLFGTVV
jgi:VIT1/CCC1 family predicted Fe2+/Mn2+ transporter